MLVKLFKLFNSSTLISYLLAIPYNVSPFTTVSELKELNHLTSDLIQIGQVLFIPTTTTTPVYSTYTVVKGDSLWLISQKYDVPVDDLIELNNLETVNLQIGDKLKIPKATSKKTYIVQKGDSLWSIAKDYNISVEELKLANNLSSNLLSIGQQLIIP